MALVALLRGVNVGGHRTFRPSILARELSDYDVVNVGAAGTFVVRKPGPRSKFRTALLRKLPFAAQVVLCEGRDFLYGAATVVAEACLERHPKGHPHTEGEAAFSPMLSASGHHIQDSGHSYAPSLRFNVAAPCDRQFWALPRW